MTTLTLQKASFYILLVITPTKGKHYPDLYHQTLILPVLELHWRRQWHPTPVFLPGESHGWRSLVGCSPWGHKVSDTTERLHFTSRINIQKRLLVHTVIALVLFCFVFKGIAILFSRVAVPFYIPSSNT